MHRDTALDLVVHGHGRVSADAHAYAHRKLSAVSKLAPGPILFAKVDLVAHADPAREALATAKAEFDVNGRVVRAHADGRTMNAAIDELEARLATRLKRAHMDPRPRRSRQSAARVRRS